MENVVVDNTKLLALRYIFKHDLLDLMPWRGGGGVGNGSVYIWKFCEPYSCEGEYLSRLLSVGSDLQKKIKGFFCS